MHHISRSNWYNGKINQFVNSDEKELYLELYPSEINRVKKLFPQLSFTKTNMVMAHSNDQRYHVLVKK